MIIPFDVTKVNKYIDKRATKPYCIWRLASVQLNKKWKVMVENYKNNPKNYSGILRGFFAGEGNIKMSSHNSRTIRIAQKECAFLEKLLEYFNVEFNYTKEDRSYNVTHKLNWDRLANIKIADLHPVKKVKFWKAYSEFKEEHYKNYYLKNSILRLLSKPSLPLDFAIMFKRSKARIQEILVDLKKEGKINEFRVGSKSYWIRNDSNTTIISKIKKNYLDLLADSNKTTKEITNYFNVDYKSSFRRLKELEKLRLVIRNGDKKWQRVISTKEVLVI